MSNDRTILTARNFLTLETMHNHRFGCSDTFSLILKKKIDSADVVFRDDLPDNVASLQSRIKYSVNGRNRDTRVLTYDHVDYPVGLSLPITTELGLALLGLAEGQAFLVPNAEGTEERIVLEKVFYQPEGKGRDKQAMNQSKTPTERRASLKILPGVIRGPWTA